MQKSSIKSFLREKKKNTTINWAKQNIHIVRSLSVMVVQSNMFGSLLWWFKVIIRVALKPNYMSSLLQSAVFLLICIQSPVNSKKLHNKDRKHLKTNRKWSNTIVYLDHAGHVPGLRVQHPQQNLTRYFSLKNTLHTFSYCVQEFKMKIKVLFIGKLRKP